MDHGHDEQHGAGNAELQALKDHLGRLASAERAVDGDPICPGSIREPLSCHPRMIDQGWNPGADQLGVRARLPAAEMPYAYRRRQACEQHTGRLN